MKFSELMVGELFMVEHPLKLMAERGDPPCGVEDHYVAPRFQKRDEQGANRILSQVVSKEKDGRTVSDLEATPGLYYRVEPDLQVFRCRHNVL